MQSARLADINSPTTNGHTENKNKVSQILLHCTNHLMNRLLVRDIDSMCGQHVSNTKIEGKGHISNVIAAISVSLGWFVITNCLSYPSIRVTPP